MRHLGPQGPLENVKDIICDFLTLKGNEGRRLPDTPLSPPTPSNNPKTPLKTPKNPQAPEIHSPVPQISEGQWQDSASNNIRLNFVTKLKEVLFWESGQEKAGLWYAALNKQLVGHRVVSNTAEEWSRRS